MPTKTIDAIILTRRNYGEADRILTAFSKKEGKVRIIAKGCRKIKSKMACHIEPFCVGKYFLVKGKGLYILAGAETSCSNHQIISNIESYKAGTYVCELLQLAFEDGQSSPYIYDLAVYILKNIPKYDKELFSIILRYYEFIILSNIGYKPDYYHCKKCHKKLIIQDTYIGNYEGFYCKECCGNGKIVDLATLKILRLFEKEDLNKIITIKDVMGYNSKLTDVIYNYLYEILPKPPKSINL